MDYEIGVGTCAEPNFIESSYNDTEFIPTNDSEYMSDVVTHDFAKLSALGYIFNNPMTRILIHETDSPFVFSKTHHHSHVACTPPKTLYWTDDQSGASSTKARAIADEISFLTPPPPPLDTVNLAITEAWANVGQADVLGLVVLAESQKTVASTIKILYRVLRIVNALRKAKWKVLRKELSPKELKEMWMEARYSLRPSYYDLKGILTALKKIAAGKHSQGRKTARSSGISCETNATDYIDKSHANTVHNVVFRWTRSSNRITTSRAGVLTDIYSSGAINALGLTRLLETAWELVPLSFAIDWFVNAGKTIASFSPLVGQKHLASWVTTTEVVTQEIVGAAISINCLKTDTDCIGISASGGGTWSKTTTDVQRAPDPSRSLTPHVNIRLDAAKLVDLIIILGQRASQIM
jgi:hypothetical protein